MLLGLLSLVCVGVAYVDARVVDMHCSDNTVNEVSADTQWLLTNLYAQHLLKATPSLSTPIHTHQPNNQPTEYRIQNTMKLISSHHTALHNQALSTVGDRSKCRVPTEKVSRCASGAAMCSMHQVSSSSPLRELTALCPGPWAAETAAMAGIQVAAVPCLLHTECLVAATCKAAQKMHIRVRLSGCSRDHEQPSCD